MKIYPDLQKYFDALPSNIQDAINDFDWARELLSLAHEYHVQIDEIEILHYETFKFILAIHSEKQFLSVVKEKLNLNADMAEKLKQSVDEQIFSELQKRAFSKENEDQDVVIEKKVDLGAGKIISTDPRLAQLLRAEGINVHHDGDILDSLPEVKQQVVPEATITAQQVIEIKKPVSYQEDITEFDLQGVSSHRTPGVNTHKKSSLHSFEEKAFTEHQVFTERRLDLSPSFVEQDVSKKGYIQHVQGSISKDSEK